MKSKLTFDGLFLYFYQVEMLGKYIMKYSQTVVFAAVCGAVLSLAASAVAQTIHPGVATVVRIAGEASYSLGDGKWHPLVAGKLLAAGAVVRTGADSTVDMVLGKAIAMPQADPAPNRISDAADDPVRGLVPYKPTAEQNTVRLTGNTVLAIDKLTVSDTGFDSVSDTELDLRQGAIYNSVKKLSGASQYLIKIPNGIAGVRGTLFYISATGECAAYKNSLVLSIIGSNGKPDTVVVGEGTRFNPRTGKTSPLPPEVINQLNQIFIALRTTYLEVVNFTFDETCHHISPTHGHHHGNP
jgi:hypothetical protein